ncbi:MAG: hypothetical protein PHE73_06840 [Sulfurovaceae bacterium]|nr:hypothetical protein [Sulfurovaceae bacterium]
MIAIHHRKTGFSEKWIEYCKNKNIAYKIVNCYDNDIIEQLKGCDALMWHWHHTDSKDILFARQLIYSLEMMGKKVFPNTKTSWHFDDKLGQKYLLEAVDSPLINSYVYYDKHSALNWIEKTTFPKVFKLRGGAGAENVKLINDKNEARGYIKKAFGKGFGLNRFAPLKERVWHFERDKSLKSFINIGRGLGRVLLPNKIKKNLPVQKHYMYAQDFIPDNDSDIRVIVIGQRAFAIKRMIRKNDFRASGSGNIIYDPKQIPLECVKLAFDTTRKLQAQCIAYDFVFLKGIPKIIEISYAFNREVYLDCPGYWNSSLGWIEGKFYPEFFMVEDMIDILQNEMDN